jgi:hypothetical protein
LSILNQQLSQYPDYADHNPWRKETEKGFKKTGKKRNTTLEEAGRVAMDQMTEKKCRRLLTDLIIWNDTEVQFFIKGYVKRAVFSGQPL